MPNLKTIFSSLLLLISSGCSNQPKTIDLSYDNHMHIDAETLAEAGILKEYIKILPELKKLIPTPNTIEELIDNDLPRYAIRANNIEYVIYSPTENSALDQGWGVATYVFFKIINDQLNNSTVRFYAFNNGNDLGGMFLTPQQVKGFKDKIITPTDWPYLPKPDAPWYGQHH